MLAARFTLGSGNASKSSCSLTRYVWILSHPFLICRSVKRFLKLTSALSQSKTEVFVLKLLETNREITKLGCLKTLPVTSYSNSNQVGEKEDLLALQQRLALSCVLWRAGKDCPPDASTPRANLVQESSLVVETQSAKLWLQQPLWFSSWIFHQGFWLLF